MQSRQRDAIGQLHELAGRIEYTAQLDIEVRAVEQRPASGTEHF